MNSLHSFSKTCAILMLLFALAIAQEPVFEQEVIVMFKPGVVEFPEGETEVQLPDVVFTAPAIENILERKSAEIIAKAFPNFTLDDTIGIARTGEIVKYPNLTHVYKIRFPQDVTIDEVAAELAIFSEVIFAERNGSAEPDLYPDDPYFDNQYNPGQGGYQWNLLNTGQNGGTFDADSDAPEAWDMTTGSFNTRIAIIDGGVENWHEDLNGKVSGDTGWGWGGHGFHVAGIAAANTNNNIGIAGVDWNAQIISEKIVNTDDAGIYSAVMSAISSGAYILNNSWKLTYDDGSPGRYSTTVRIAFANAYKSNLFVAASMGNTGHTTNTVQYPAAFGQGITTVGATTRDDVRWYKSTYGNHIDVVAPGDQIISCVPYSTYLGHYDIRSGTSMATPLVSGVAGLLLSENPDLYNDDIERIIRISTDKVPSMGGQAFTEEYGTGRINSRRALNYLQSPYVLNQWTANNGYTYGTPIEGNATFYGLDLPVDGEYWAIRHEVRETVTFPQSFAITPRVWGRGVATTGFSNDDPNFGMRLV
ncbi:MAG: S8 family serine peptidase [Fidelibacterota bacterium]